MLWSQFCKKVLETTSRSDENKDFRKKRIYQKKNFKVNEKSNLGVLRINQAMCKSVTLSQRLQWNCQQVTAVVYIATLYFEHSKHFPYHLGYYIIIHHSWKLLRSDIMLYYAYVNFKWTSQSCRSSKIFQSLNVE